MVYHLWMNKAVEKARTYQNVCGGYCLSHYIENSLRPCEQFFRADFIFNHRYLHADLQYIKKTKDPEEALLSNTCKTTYVYLAFTVFLSEKVICHLSFTLNLLFLFSTKFYKYLYVFIHMSVMSFSNV